MNTASIYYFSATGNSLSTAREIMHYLPDGSRLIPVTSMRNEPIVEEAASVIGFVFPVYFQDIPFPVRDLLEKIVFLHENPYIFAFTTSRGYPGDLIGKRVHRILRKKGGSLSLTLGIPMPGNSLMNTAEEDAVYLAEQKTNIQKKMEMILRNVKEDYRTDDSLFITPANVPNNFRGINACDRCVRCGLCVSVCPMDNIRIVDGKAVVGDHCASCLACFHWCPVEAIQMTKNTEDGNRPKYHHPEVTIHDICMQKHRGEGSA